MTERCPVCLHPADRSYHGDKEQVRCPRCGIFEISGTALAMLGSRVDQDPRTRARLSHAIRSNTSEGSPLFISSANLDELARQTLPGVQQQLELLTRWVAALLGDDRLGRVRCPSPELLAGVVGATTGDRVSRLIGYAVNKGIVERDNADDSVGLSPEGWAMAEPPREKQASDRKPVAPAASPEIVKSHCNECGGERNAYKRASHTVRDHDDETEWSDTYEVLECCGCSSLSVRHKFWFSAWDDFDYDPMTRQPRIIPGVRVTYWPPPTKRKKPEWADDLDDDVLRRIIDEVYQALNAGMIVLASIGTRTLLDRAMLLRVGDQQSFAKKLDQMIQRGHIGADERGILEAITDAGSAAAHRGFAPNAKTLATIVATVENFLHREFVLKTAAGEVRTATPPRKTATRSG